MVEGNSEFPRWFLIGTLVVLTVLLAALTLLGWWSLTEIGLAVLSVLVSVMGLVLYWLVKPVLPLPNRTKQNTEKQRWSEEKLREHYRLYARQVLVPLSKTTISNSFLLGITATPQWFLTFNRTYEPSEEVLRRADLYRAHLARDFPSYDGDFRKLAQDVQSVQIEAADLRGKLNVKTTAALGGLEPRLQTTDYRYAPTGQVYVDIGQANDLLVQRWQQEALPRIVIDPFERISWPSFRSCIAPKPTTDGTLVADGVTIGRFALPDTLRKWYDAMDQLVADGDLFLGYWELVQHQRGIDAREKGLQERLKQVLADIENNCYCRDPGKLLPCCRLAIEPLTPI